MSDHTLFVSAVVQAYPDDVSDPSYSRIRQVFDEQIRYNLKMFRLETIALDDNDTRTVTLPGIAVLASWQLILVRVVGSAVVETTGKDTNGVTTINGYQPVFGTEVLPGIAFLSTYNVTAIVIRGEADDTTVEILTALSEEDA
jgi:hypothetical protein